MKSYKLILLILLLTGSINATAQYLDNYKGIIRVYPVNFVFGSASLGYEQILTDRNSFEYILSYNFFDIIALDKDAHDFKRTMPVNGIGARVNFRFYFKTNNLYNKHFYIAPQVMAKLNKGKNIKVEHAFEERRILQINNFAAGLLIQGGVQVLSKVFYNILDFYIGFGLKYNTYRYNELRVQEYINLGNFVVHYKDKTPRGIYTTSGHGPYSGAVHIGISIGFPHK